MAGGHGRTLLHICAISNSTQVMKFLIKFGLPLDVRDYEGDSPFSTAARCGNQDMALYLLEIGGGLDNDRPDQPKVLHSVAAWNLKELGRKFLRQSGGCDVNIAYKGGTTPLNLAICEKNLSAVEMLLDHNADAARPDDNGIRPIHLASSTGNVELFTNIAGKLSDKEFSTGDNNDRTPLHFAAESGSAALVDLLLNKYHVKPAATRDGLQPIHFAARSGAIPVVEALTEVEGLVAENWRVSPLHIAAANGAVPVVEWLIDHGTPVDLPVKSSGQTALMIATSK